MSDLISFPKEYFIKEHQRPLTKLMIEVLRLACNKQKNNILFGPTDIKGSLTPLIKRGLICRHTIKRHGKFQITWYVTIEAMNMLRDIDPKISC